jgi:dihydroorotate dehydrogenase
MPAIYPSLRRLLFRLDPEDAHQLTLRLLQLAGSIPGIPGVLRSQLCLDRPELRVRAFGLDFSNPIGLAAGYDKDGGALRGLACLGFGHLELGTVTPTAQPGNPRPRIFRLPDDQALINRMGFPNRGADALAGRLRRNKPKGVIVGVNIGKGKATPIESAAEDYVLLLRQFAPLADYLAVNISSPNTIGLRRLQGRGFLEGLLSALAGARRETLSHDRPPVLVKLAPDLTDGELEDAVGAIQSAGMDGVIATNTTVARPPLGSPLRDEQGGLSGAPLRARSTEVIRRIHSLTRGELPIVAAGGVFEARDAHEKLDGGACLVQVYTGLVYRGPRLARMILEGLGESRSGA